MEKIMSTVNILIGLGGTGSEVINDFLKITSRYPLKENKFEWFVFDSASLDKARLKQLVKEPQRYIKSDGFNSSRIVINDLLKKYPDSNLNDIFPKGDYLRENDISSHGGAWEIRKMGFLILLYHIFTSDENIFDKIIKSISKYPKRAKEEDDEEKISNIKVFIVNSIAGGTGSGLFLPFSSFLRQQLKNKYIKDSEFDLTIFSFLALPNFVAKGLRDPKDDLTRNRYQANAYEALLEINSLIQKKMSWNVKLTDDYRFEFSYEEGFTADDEKEKKEVQRTIADNFFLFNDSNVVNQSIVIPNISDTDQAYKPNFQQMAWSLYLMCCGDKSYYENGAGNSLNKKGFAGIGVLPIEFPQEAYIFRVSKKLLENTPQYLNIVSKPASHTFNFSFQSYLAESEKSFKQQCNNYTYELSQLGKDNLQAIKQKKPIIIRNDINDYYKKFVDEINQKIIDLLGVNTIQQISSIVNIWYQETTKDKEKFEKEIINYKTKIETKERELINQNKYSKIIKSQEELFTLIYQLVNRESYRDLINKILFDLSKKIAFFESLTQIFVDRSIYRVIKIEEPEYFKFPPPFIEKGFIDNDIENMALEIFNDIMKQEKSKSKSSGENLFEENFLQNIWDEFSKNELNKKVLSLYEDYLVNNYDKFNKNDLISKNGETLIKDWFFFIKDFIKNKKSMHFANKNWLFDLYNKGNIKNLGYSYPLIPLSSLDKNKKGKKAIFCDVVFKDKITGKGESDLQGYKEAEKYQVLNSDCLVIFSSLVGAKKWEELEISSLRESYSSMKKEDEKNAKKDPPESPRYVFIDPRFEEK